MTEQLEFEKAVHQQKMRTEISQAKREANFFAEQVEKGNNLRKLEENVLKKGGKWQTYNREVQQRKNIQGNETKQKNSKRDSSELFGMIFKKNE